MDVVRRKLLLVTIETQSAAVISPFPRGGFPYECNEDRSGLEPHKYFSYAVVNTV